MPDIACSLVLNSCYPMVRLFAPLKQAVSHIRGVRATCRIEINFQVCGTDREEYRSRPVIVIVVKLILLVLICR